MSAPEVINQHRSTSSSTAVLLTALLSACVAFQLNASMLSPALVTMSDELNTNEAAVGFTQTAFFTASAMFSMFLPRYSDIAGRKRVLQLALLVMLAGSIVAALTPNVALLFAARAIQGISGPIVVISLLMLRSEVSDPKRLGTMMGVVAAVNGGIAGVDALAGGWLAANFGFRSLFWVIAAVTVVATVLVTVGCRESRPSSSTPMDWPAVFPLVVGVAALLLAVEELKKLTDADWMVVIALAIVAVAAAVLFWWLENRRIHPLVRIVDLRNRGTWALLLTTVLTLTGVFAAVNGVLMSFVQNADTGFGMGADRAALVFLTPFALVGWLVGAFAGRLAPKVGYRRLLRGGLVTSVGAMAVMAFVGVDSLPVMIVCTVVLGMSYAGVANIVLNLLGVVLAPADRPGFLPGLNSAAFGLGSGVSFAVLPAVQVSGNADSGSSSGYVAALLTGMAIVLAAWGVSFLLPRPSTAEEVL